jgi:hypothetical protein
MSPRHAKRTSSVSAATRYRAATASRRACKRISAKSATRARALWRTSTRFPATIRSESQECGGGDLLRRSALAPAALLGNHFRCELLNSLRMHLSSASCDPSGRVGDDMVLLLHRPRELRWDIRACRVAKDFRASKHDGKGGLAGLETALHPGASSAHSPGHVEHSALSVTALAQADTSAKVRVAGPASRARRHSLRAAEGKAKRQALRPSSCSLLSVAANNARAQTRISYTLPRAISSLRQRISSSTGGSTITYQLPLRIEYVKEPAFLSPHRIPICAAFKWST